MFANQFEQAVYSIMTKRKKIRPDVETQLLVECGRRCCLCFGFSGDLSIKQGQIAHLDHDPAHSQLDNLAFLCLLHHDQYDSSTSQSKGITIKEVKHYRNLLSNVVAELRKLEIEKQHLSLGGDKKKALEFMGAKTYIPANVGEDISQSRGVKVIYNGKTYLLPAYTNMAGSDEKVSEIYPDYADDGNDALTWGYFGSGPSYTAYSILRDLFNVEIASQYAYSFEVSIIEHLPVNSAWMLTSNEIASWLDLALADQEIF